MGSNLGTQSNSEFITLDPVSRVSQSILEAVDGPSPKISQQIIVEEQVDVLTPKISQEKCMDLERIDDSPTPGTSGQSILGTLGNSSLGLAEDDFGISEENDVEPVPGNSTGISQPPFHAIADESDDAEYSTWTIFKCNCCKSQHREMEEAMLRNIRAPYRFHYVNIGNCVGNEECKIWTLSVNESAEGIPILLLHGFASGLGLWSLNIDQLASNRPVYAIDLLGFGASSRPQFSSDADEVEDEFVRSLEAWRIAMNIDKFVVVGHSFGGFLSVVYSIRYPNAVEHLVLADPWGFKERQHSGQVLNISSTLLAVMKVLGSLNITPLWMLRILGRVAPVFIQFFRQDLIQHFSPDIEDANRVLSHYIYYINAKIPTGEQAFKSLMASFGWAKYPLSFRIHKLHESIPLTVVYGTKSWIDHATAEEIHHNRSGAFVDTHLVEGCGHHVYTENRSAFNKIVLQACMNTKSRNLADNFIFNNNSYIDDD